jgi:hypothetical protein
MTTDQPSKNIMVLQMKTKLFFNIYYLCSLLLFTIFIISSCSSNEPKVGENNNFGIYLLADQSITWESIQERNLDSLKLKEWITNDMIDSVDYSSQVFYLNVDYNNLLSFSHNSNTPFIVVANGKRCYCGRFGPPKDTTQPCVTFTPMALCTDLVMLEFNPPQRKDIRINDDVKSALKSLGKLKQGISLSLYRIDELIDLDSGNKFNPRFVSLTIFRNNNESDYIYCKGHKWDIIKAGNKTYESKLVIYDQSTYYSIPPIIMPHDTLVYKKKEVLDPELGYRWEYFRPFLKDEYSSDACTEHYIPEGMKNGTYYCFLEYYGGMMGGDKTMRRTPKGRMWMGYMRSNTIQVQYDSTKTFWSVLNANVTLP